MSILNGPRLNFWGGIRTNVSVPNNAATLPIDNGQTLALFDLTTSTVSPPAQAYSDDQLNQFINAPPGSSTPPAAGTTMASTPSTCRTC